MVLISLAQKFDFFSILTLFTMLSMNEQNECDTYQFARRGFDTKTRKIRSNRRNFLFILNVYLICFIFQL